MAKVAVGSDVVSDPAQAGTPPHAARRVLASGAGWEVADVLCSRGPDDRAFEEQHEVFSIAIVASGTFEYRSSLGRELMTPGALMLGSPGQRFECSHEHGTGDRCIAFSYEPAWFERVAATAGARGQRLDFPVLRMPPQRALASAVARACAGVAAPEPARWEEIATLLAGDTLNVLAGGAAPGPPATAFSLARVARCVRTIDRHLAEVLDLGRLAQLAGLSPFHFLRTFQQVTGVTPHQYLLRVRLRRAAELLAGGSPRVLDVALDCGFGDLSNFNRAFRAEFGVSPKQFQGRRGAGSGREPRRAR